MVRKNGLSDTLIHCREVSTPPHPRHLVAFCATRGARYDVNVAPHLFRPYNSRWTAAWDEAQPCNFPHFVQLSSARETVRGTRRQRTGVSAPNAEGQSFCSFSCSSPLWVIQLFVGPQGAMRTEGRDVARWPWLLSRPDRALRCPHGRVVRAMVTSTESVNGDSCWVLSALGGKIGTGIFHGCAHIVLSLGRLCGREWRGQHRGV